MTSDVLLQVASGTAPSDAQWPELKDSILAKLSEAKMDNASIQFASQTIQGFERPPYTIQRVCELILTPPGTQGALYDSWDKYSFALERALYVTSETREACNPASPMDIDEQQV